MASSEEGDPRAETLPCRGHFDADTARADDSETCRHFAAVRRFAVGPRPRLGDPRNIGQRGGAAGADGHRVARGQHDQFVVGGGDSDSAGPVEPSVPADQFGSDLLDSVGLSGVVPQRDVTVAAAEDALHRNGTADGFARTVDTAGVRHRDHWTQQGLAGNAAPVGTFTADEFALDDRDSEPSSTGSGGDILADRTRTQDDHVVAVLRCAVRRLGLLAWPYWRVHDRSPFVSCHRIPERPAPQKGRCPAISIGDRGHKLAAWRRARGRA